MSHVQPRPWSQMPGFESCLCRSMGMLCVLKKLGMQKCLRQCSAHSELSMCRVFIIIIASSAHVQVVMALMLGTITQRVEKPLPILQFKQ